MLSGTAQTRHHRIYVIALSILLALFCFRVLAQLLQLYIDIPFLPPFEAWQSGAVPYKGLLAAQILIIVFYAWILRRFASGRIRPNRKPGWIFFIIGLIYFLVMAVRLFVGLTGLSEHYWFHSYLPTLFHFVISGYLLVVGYYHLQATARPS
jgi:hypothetical protein